MLIQLTIHDYIIAEQLEIELRSGLTSITGETGAGKSVILGALGLALGERGDASSVKKGAKKTDISAVFDISSIPEAQQWLQSRDMFSDNECILRRTLSCEGRSKAWINSTPCTIQDLKSLGSLLGSIHSQHAQQKLLQKSQHRIFLDNWGGHEATLKKVSSLAHEWSEKNQQLQTLITKQKKVSTEQQLLQYQLDELLLLGLTQGEVEQLEEEQALLQNSSELQQIIENASALCVGNEYQEHETYASRQIQNAINLLQKGNHLAPSQFSPVIELLESSMIQLAEAEELLKNNQNLCDTNPEKLSQINQRLDNIYLIARKHQLLPEQLFTQQAHLQSQLQLLTDQESSIAKLQADIDSIQQQYIKHATQLSKQRKKACLSLSKNIEDNLKKLAMPHCKVNITLTEKKQESPQPDGLESVEILICTNPGQAFAPIKEVASGGELSRISLAIQVAIASTTTTPTLIFDEVDVGIGGATADIVGQLLRQLGEHHQAICITHLAQVAAKSHQHLLIQKHTNKKEASTSIVALDDTDKITEIARMLGGVAVTETSLAHAEEMIGALH